MGFSFVVCKSADKSKEVQGERPLNIVSIVFMSSSDSDSIRVNQAPAFDQFYHLSRLLRALSACLEFLSFISAWERCTRLLRVLTGLSRTITQSSATT